MSFVATEMVVLSKVLLIEYACACMHTQADVSFIGGRELHRVQAGLLSGCRCCFCRGCAESEDLYLAEQMVAGPGL